MRREFLNIGNSFYHCPLQGFPRDPPKQLVLVTGGHGLLHGVGYGSDGSWHIHFRAPHLALQWHQGPHVRSGFAVLSAEPEGDVSVLKT